MAQFLLHKSFSLLTMLYSVIRLFTIQITLNKTPRDATAAIQLFGRAEGIWLPRIFINNKEKLI